jgi:O-antigen/teichoic acid export membrane protein
MVADFIVGFFIARIPILLFQAVQAALLPKLAGLAGSDRLADFRTGLRKLVVIVLGVGVLGIVGGITVGPTVGKILFGDKFNLDRIDLGLLCAGSAAFILALTLAQALIALHGHARAFVAWLLGLVTAIVVTAVSSHELFHRIEYGFLAGCAMAAAMMAVLLRSSMRAATPESLSLFVEQIEHEPLEI